MGWEGANGIERHVDQQCVSFMVIKCSRMLGRGLKFPTSALEGMLVGFLGEAEGRHLSKQMLNYIDLFQQTYERLAEAISANLFPDGCFQLQVGCTHYKESPTIPQMEDMTMMFPLDSFNMFSAETVIWP